MNNDTPELRFNNFTNGPIKYKLSEITKRIKSYSLSRNVETKEDTGYKYIHYGDIHKKVANIIDRESRLPNIKPGNYELLKRGDLVIADASEDYQGIAAPSIVNDNLTYNIVAGLHTIALRPIKADSLYLYYLFNSQKFRKYGYKVGTGMKVFGISVSNLVQFESYIPSISEQVEVGILLKKVDQTIKLQQQLLNDHKQLKKAMLQKMFPQKGKSVPRIRFAGFDDVWEETYLKDISAYKNGKGHEKNQSEIGKYELINLNSISINGGLKPSGKFVNSADEILRKNDLVMILSDIGHGDLLGRTALIPEDNRFVLNQRVALLRPYESINSEFLLHCINNYQNYFKIKGAGMSQLNLSKSSVEMFLFLLPSFNEQIKIGNFFKQLDENIVLHEQKLETYQELKKAMLQKMFV